MLLGLELKGRHAVLVGEGRIGKETEKLFRGIGLKTEWITRRDTSRSIQKKLARAQVLSLHVPLTPQTHHWLSRERIALLPPDAIVLNTTRGPVVDEKALTQALKKRTIFAAGLDVFEREPHIPRELRYLPNVVLLPHLGSATEEARRAMAHLVIHGILRLLGGKPAWNEVKFVRGK
jgi:glyoxylate reductase